MIGLFIFFFLALAGFVLDNPNLGKAKLGKANLGKAKLGKAEQKARAIDLEQLI